MFKIALPWLKEVNNRVTLRILSLCLACKLSISAQVPEQAAVAGPNAHAWETFQLFRQMTKGNFCFSPFSGHRVAAMLAEGAQGETQRQIIGLAHLATEKDKRTSEAEAIRQELAAGAARGGMVLEVANSIWAPPASTLVPDYVTWVEKRFGASVKTLPPTDAVGCASKVNQWIREKTRGRITDLVGPSVFQAGDGAVLLVNSIYLKSVWSNPFDPRATKPRAFTTASGSRTMLSMMVQQNGFAYADTAAWQCLDMPFGVGDFSMTLLLPKVDTDRASAEDGLNPESWAKVLTSLGRDEVSVMLPRFSFSTQVNLQGLWQALGVSDAFEQTKADLGGMILQKPCWVNQVLHEATIEVNELGAKASAATAAADPFGPAEAKPKPRVNVFIANRPFLWLIRHQRTGLILFMGRFAGE